MSMHTYIGARYVPNFTGTFDPTQQYEVLDVVDNGSGTSYILKKPAPVGTPITDGDYWALYGAASGAIINLQNQIGSLGNLNTTNQDNLVDAVNEVLTDITNDLYYVTPQMYGAVADGVTDDTAAIQAAIDAADVVVFPKASGEYIFTHLETHANSKLIGAGGILKFKDNTAVDNTQSYYPIWAIHDNTVIDGLQIDGNGSNNSQFVVCDTITISGKNSKIINCILNDAPDSSIMVSTNDNIEVKGNVINGARDCGIYVNSSGMDNLKYFILSNNIINGCGTSAIACKRESSKGIIDSNIMYNCLNAVSMEAVSPFGSSGNITINNNYINDMTSTAINVRKEKNYTISNNIIKNFVTHAVSIQECENVTVIGNTIDSSVNAFGGTYRGAFFVYNPTASSYSKNVIFANNVILIQNTDGTLLDVHGDARMIHVNNNAIEFTNASNNQNLVSVITAGGITSDSVYLMGNSVIDSNNVHVCSTVSLYCNNTGSMRPYQPNVARDAIPALIMQLSSDSSGPSSETVRIMTPFKTTSARNAELFKKYDIVPDTLTANTFKLYVAKADGAGSSVLTEALSVSLS